MKKVIIILIMAMACVTVRAQNVNLISLGSGTFTLDGGSTIGTGTQDTSGLIWSSSVALGDQLGGTFATSNWTLYTNPPYTGFGVVMSVNGPNPNLAFSLLLYDDAFNLVDTYNGSTLGVSGTPTTVSLLLSTPGTQDYSSITGAVFTWGGAGTINTKVTDIVAVPEPSTYALLALSALGFGGYVVRRRRRA